MTKRDFRDESRKNWHAAHDRPLNLKEITAGCMLRVADATELMAKDHQRLIREKEFYQSKSERVERLLEKERRRNAALRDALRGHLKRAKREK